MRRSTGKKIILAVLYLLCIPGILCASVLQVSWNPNSESDLCGYRVYYGTNPGSYRYVLDTGNTTSVTVDGFIDGNTYYIAVTAYDFSGNESDYSQEEVISIPQQLQQGIISSVMQWIEGLIQIGQDGNSQLAQYDLADFSAIGQQGVVTTIRIVRVEESSSITPSEFTAEDQSDYIIRDVIAEAGEYLDIASLYPQGTYFFLPISEGSAVIENDVFSAGEPGVYLFMVADASGEPIHILRVSVFDKLTALSEYESGSELYLEDAELGISLALSPQAFELNLPIGIGLNSSQTVAPSTLGLVNDNIIEFAIAPYGLVLSEPAEIRMLFNGSSASVEYFDEGEKQWVAVKDVRVEDGMVVFSSEALGRFKVYGGQGEAVAGIETPYDSNSDSNGFCFISSCQK